MANRKSVNCKMTVKDFDIYREYVDKCREIIRGTGIPCTDCTNNLKLNFINSYRTLGSYGRGTKTLSISKPYFEYCLKTNNTQDLENTIIHELLHSIAENKQAGCGHTGVWKWYAQVVSENTNYKIQRCAENKSFLTCEEKVAKKRTSTTIYKIACVDCGKVYTYRKMCKAVQHIASGNSRGYKCTCGSKKLELQ